jgi:hypothetical protein
MRQPSAQRGELPSGRRPPGGALEQALEGPVVIEQRLGRRTSASRVVAAMIPFRSAAAKVARMLTMASDRAR